MSKEHLIKEARTIEAMKNGYMGLEGKFANITKNLGSPIYHQGSSVFEQTFLDDPYEIKDPNDILTMDDDENSYEMGLLFDGLSRGINMTISVHYHLREITCRYEGSIVYKEVSGELEGYNPYDLWEEKINSLYLISKKLERQRKPFEQAKLVEMNKKKRNEALDYLKSKWGL